MSWKPFFFTFLSTHLVEVLCIATPPSFQRNFALSNLLRAHRTYTRCCNNANADTLQRFAYSCRAVEHTVSQHRCSRIAAALGPPYRARRLEHGLLYSVVVQSNQCSVHRLDWRIVVRRDRVPGSVQFQTSIVPNVFSSPRERLPTVVFWKVRDRVTQQQCGTKGEKLINYYHRAQAGKQTRRKKKPAREGNIRRATSRFHHDRRA